MKNKKKKNEIFAYRVSIICRLFFLALVFLPIYADSVSADNQGNLIKTNKSDIEIRFLNKYKLTHIVIQGDDAGAVGLFRMNGDLTPKNYVPLKGVDQSSRSRHLADKFLETEAPLFGVKNPANDFKEKASVIDRHGNTHISYYRFVNGLRLDQMEVVVHIDQAGKVFSVNGNIIPIIPATEEFIKSKNQKDLLTINDATAVIIDDLKKSDIDKDAVNFKKMEKIAISTEPYVVWSGDVVLTKGIGRWFYIIDAHTGEIMEKSTGIKSHLHFKTDPVILKNAIVQCCLN